MGSLHQWYDITCCNCFNLLALSFITFSLYNNAPVHVSDLDIVVLFT